MKQVTLNNILHVKLNSNKQCYEHVSDTVVDKFFRVKDRKIEFYLGCMYLCMLIMYVKTFILGLGFISVPARISKGQGAGPEKGHFLACCWIFKKGML
jgi:hypothetical protein